ncbi:MAG: putative Fur family transcriptional regulator [Acidimicrobiaceae bacterium]|nr:putative Fur family transcriptional regulator [Acidimicrobiaceae bacterium]
MSVLRPRTADATRPSANAHLDLHELVETHLRRIDQRYTSGRQAVVQLLATSGRPLSISDISSAAPDVPRSSAYRHLSDLQRAGVVRRIAASDEFARFELAEDLTHHHHHLLCSNCGKVIDVTPSPAFEATVASMVDDLTLEQGFHATSHALDVIGHCASCQAT